LRRYWVRFAATGDPNQPGMPSWPTYRSPPTRHLEIGDPIRVVDGFNRPGCDAFDEAWANE
jgi:carboxylesterase type B